jgi:competence protein ComEC
VLAATHMLRTALLDITTDLSPQARGLVPGAAIGDTTRVPPDVTEAMRVTGLTHVTAVSGGHFAVVVATLTAACVMLRVPRALRVAVLAVAAVGFVLLVRPEPSVLRAAWTCAVALLGLALGRPSSGPAALATASTVLLVVDPWLARSFGFALSCAATGGLVLIAGPLARRLAPWLGRPLAFGLAVPLAAQAAVGPVLVLLDPSVPTTAVLANLLAAPALVPATVLGLVATVLAPGAPGLAHGVAWLAGIATGWIAAVARWCAGLPGASLPWPGGVGGALLLAAATAGVLVVVLRRPVGEGWPRSWREVGPRLWRRARRQALRRRGGVPAAFPAILSTALIVAVAVVLVGALVLPRGLSAGHGLPPDWEIVACDVGQGDALAVRTGVASAVVVDVGPPGDAAGRCLDRLGVEHIDLLVLSHFHADHVGGLEPVLTGRSVEAALVSPLDEPPSNAARARDALAAAGVPVQAAAPGQAGVAGATSWWVLGADGTSVMGEGDGANDASVALALRTPGGIDVVALGDLETAGQEALFADLRAAGWARGVDVVKMAHHGSAEQSHQLAALLGPRLTLVSVGDDNTYGHPTETALDLYAGVGSALVRTDECGTAALVVRDGGIGLACTRAR